MDWARAWAARLVPRLTLFARDNVSWSEALEAREGFEPSNGGFADLSLRPLGYRALLASV